MLLRLLIPTLTLALLLTACGSADLAPGTGGSDRLPTLPETLNSELIIAGDKEPPIASLSSTVLDSGEVEVTLSAEDPGEKPSGIAGIQYWIWDEGGREQRFIEPFTVPSGTEIDYRAVDNAGYPDGPKSYVVLEGQVNAAHGELEVDGSPVEVTAEGETNQIRLNFEGQARQHVRVDLEEVDPGKAIERMVVVGPDQRAVEAWTKPREGDDDLRVRFWNTGTHTLLLKFDEDDEDVTVRVRLEHLADVEATLEATGEPMVVKIEEPGQEAYVHFEGRAGQQIRFIALDSIFPGSIPEIYVEFRDPLGELVDDYPIRKPTSRVRRDYTLDHDGRYTVRINPYKENTGQITLALVDVEAETRTFDVDGPAVEFAIEGRHDSAWLEFEAESDIWLRLEIATTGGESSCCSNAVYIKDTEGETINSTVHTLIDGAVRKWANGRPALIFSVGTVGVTYWFQVPKHGTYTIEINPEADSVSQTKLSLTYEKRNILPPNR